jgi:hypothetical protein
MSREEWFSLPWYEAETYLEGLRLQGILNNGEKQDSGPTQSPGKTPSGPKKKTLDLASADPGQLSGFQFRRAG